jgi:hypothetical protein
VEPAIAQNSLAARHLLEIILQVTITIVTVAGKYLHILEQELLLLLLRFGVLEAAELVLAAVLMVFLLVPVLMHIRRLLELVRELPTTSVLVL